MKTCTQCGAAMADDSPQGLCARCLLDLAMQTGDFAPVTSDSHLAADASVKPGNESAPPRTESMPIGDVLGKMIGDYKVIQQIGEGGFGTVFMAEQLRPVRRKVALKIIKLGMDTKQVVGRFEAERQALAIMDHPNIAKVLDAGATDNGRPYFVMELVRGVPITDYCDVNNLSVPERLELFVKVCEAVQHAHQKGIIHRDIKPSNVLVAMADSVPTPKVIDFGIAKATDQRLTEKTVFTEFHQMIGTPQYMSPEQAEMAGIDIDTRSDVYSLGVLLYELLVGSTPFDPKELRSKAYGELQRMIREVEPPRPSTRLSSLADTIATIAAHRRIEPAKLGNILRGELDWVVMRAMEKDRTRRYETANGLAADVRRYLAGEAVLAAPPGKGYRLKKMVRRNKGPVVAAALVMAALVLGILGTSVGLVRAQRARHAEAARAEGERQAREMAEKRLSQIKKGNEILGSIFQALNPDSSHGDYKPLRALLGDRLDQAAKELQSEAIGDPLMVAELQLTLGESQMGLGFAMKAIPLFSAARTTYAAQLGPADRNTLICTNDLASAYEQAGQYDLALPLHQESLKQTQAKVAANDPDAIISTINVAQDYEDTGKPALALPLFESALRLCRSRSGADDSTTILALTHLGNAYSSSGKSAQALPLLEEALQISKEKLGPEHFKTLTAMRSLASAEVEAGKFDLGISLLKTTVALSTAKLGREHVETLRSMGSLANAYREAGKLNLAVDLGQEAFKLAVTNLGRDDPASQTIIDDLASIYEDNGNFDQAVVLLEDSAKRKRARLGADHPVTLTSEELLANAYLKNGRADLALPTYLAVLKEMSGRLGAEHPETIAARNNLAMAYQALKDFEHSLPLFEQNQKATAVTYGAENPRALTSTNNVAQAYREAGKLDLAQPMAEKSLKSATLSLGPTNPITLYAMNTLAGTYYDSGNITKAIPLFEDALKIAKSTLGPDNPTTLTAMGNLGNAYRQAGRLNEAIPLLEQALRQQKERLPPGHADTRLTMNNLLVAYTEAGKTELALPLVDQIYSLQKGTPQRDHPMTAADMNNLATTYMKLGKHDLALPLLEESIKQSKATYGPDELPTLVAMNNLAMEYLYVSKPELAKPIEEEALKLSTAKLGKDHRLTLRIQASLAIAYRGTGRVDDAIQILEEMIAQHPTLPRDLAWIPGQLGDTYETAKMYDKQEPMIAKELAETRQRTGDNSLATASVLARLARNLLLQKRYHDAEAPCRQSLVIRQAQDPDGWTTFNTQSMLGGALLGQQKYTDAEPLLISGYAGLKERKEKIPADSMARVTEAIDRLVQLYDATEKPEESAKWRKELEAAQRLAKPGN